MRKLIVLLVLVACGVSFAGLPSRLSGGGSASSISTQIAKESNCKIVYPGDSLLDAYTWLKSSDRASNMGTLSITNRRALLLYPGTYTLSATLTLDSNGVDIVGVGKASDIIITRATGGITITQTAADVQISNVRITNQGSASGDQGLVINASPNNNASIYSDCIFNTGYDTLYPTLGMDASNGVSGVSDLGGTWYRCTGGGYSWRVAENKTLNATMYDCVGGYRAYGGDASGASISGTMTRCTGGRGSFGGCANYGCNITGTLIDCNAGDGSYALGKTFSGTAIRCRGGFSCFGGWDGLTSPSNPGKFTGYAEDCIVAGGWSFGSGTSGECSGIIKRCIWGNWGQYSSGVSIARSANIIDRGASATLNNATLGSTLTFTAKGKGRGANSYTLQYEKAAGKTNAGTVKDPLATLAPQWAIVVSAAGTSTVAQIKGWIEANAGLNSIISATYSGDGSETVAGASTTAYSFSGGVDSPMFANNYPMIPMACATNTTILAFDNGATYTNGGATGTIIFTLPTAIVGLKYDFRVAADQSLRLEPGSETIVAGVGESAGDYIWADATGESCTLECIISGQWKMYNVTGTWDDE